MHMHMYMCMHMCVELTGGPPVRWFVIYTYVVTVMLSSEIRGGGPGTPRECHMTLMSLVT